MFDQLLIGVVSGLVSSLCFLLFLLLVKPNIKISEELCKDPDCENIYRIKVVNKSRVVLNEVHYSLHYCEDAGDGIKEIQEIQPRKTRMSFFDKYTKKCDDYAVRLSYEIDLNKYPLDKGVLEFNIRACHSLSNTMSCGKRIYKISDIKEGEFETGKSMRILIRNKRKTQLEKEAECAAIS